MPQITLDIFSFIGALASVPIFCLLEVRYKRGFKRHLSLAGSLLGFAIGMTSFLPFAMFYNLNHGWNATWLELAALALLTFIALMLTLGMIAASVKRTVSVLAPPSWILGFLCYLAYAIWFGKRFAS